MLKNENLKKIVYFNILFTKVEKHNIFVYFILIVFFSKYAFQ